MPGKNLIVYKNRTLVNHAITNALNSNIFDFVILSSENTQILAEGNFFLSDQRFISLSRPGQLSEDDVRADEVVRYVIKQKSISSKSIVCCLLPTTPSITPEILNEAFIEFNLKGLTVGGTLFGVTESIQTPFRNFEMTNERELLALFPKYLHLQSNDYPRTFTDAGQFYFANVETWEKNYSITATYPSFGFTLNQKIFIDINTQEDWDRYVKENS